MTLPTLTTRLFDGFEDSALGPAAWEHLCARSPTDTVFQTRAYLRAWWDVFGRGRLLLIGAEDEEGGVQALAPFFCDGGMVFFVGSGGSDYLDVLGDVSDPDVLDGLLRAAMEHTPGFVGFRCYHVPDASPTGTRLHAAAGRLGLACYDEGHLAAPAMDLTDPAVVEAAINKKSLRRHERWFRREGRLTVTHLRDGGAIRPHLEAFFDQHVGRWAETPYPSLFLDPQQRAFYERLCETPEASGFLRFTRVDWEGRPVAFHFGFSHSGRYLWYKPSFDVALAKRSPGEVLMRHLLRAARDEGTHTFDLGLGDEAFKQRFATRTPTVRTWGLYPPGEAGP